MSLGDKLQENRKRIGLSQEQLGEKLNVTRQTISNWELEETSPNTKQLKQLSEVFSISIDDLLDNSINKKTKNNLKKIIIIIVLLLLLLIIILILINSYHKKEPSIVEETITCIIDNNNYKYTITYNEQNNIIINKSGDSYYTENININKYSSAEKTFNLIKDYANKNNGTCVISTGDNNLTRRINIRIKEGTLTNKGATFIISEEEDYDITFGEEFYLEKYNPNTEEFEEINKICDNCFFNLPAYKIDKNKPIELEQNWDYLYGELDIGVYKLVKEVSFNNEKYYIFNIFSIE